MALRDYYFQGNQQLVDSYWKSKAENAKKAQKQLANAQNFAINQANGNIEHGLDTPKNIMGVSTPTQSRYFEAKAAETAKRLALFRESEQASIDKQNLDRRSSSTMPEITEEQKQDLQFRLNNYEGNTTEHVADTEFDADMERSKDYIAAKYGQELANYVDNRRMQSVSQTLATATTFDKDRDRRGTFGTVSNLALAGGGAFIGTTQELLDTPWTIHKAATGKEYDTKLGSAASMFNALGSTGGDSYYQNLNEEIYEDTLQKARNRLIKAGQVEDSIQAGDYLKDLNSELEDTHWTSEDVARTAGGLAAQIATPEAALGIVGKTTRGVKSISMAKKGITTVDDAVSRGAIKASSESKKFGMSLDDYKIAIERENAKIIQATGKPNIVKAQHQADTTLRNKYTELVNDEIAALSGLAKAKAIATKKVFTKDTLTNKLPSAVMQGGSQGVLSYNSTKQQLQQDVLNKIDSLSDGQIALMRKHDISLDTYIKAHPEMSEKEAIKKFAEPIIKSAIATTVAQDALLFSILSPYAKAGIGIKEAEHTLAGYIADGIRGSIKGIAVNSSKLTVAGIKKIPTGKAVIEGVANSSTAKLTKGIAKGAGVANKYAIAPVKRIVTPTAMMGAENAIQGAATAERLGNVEQNVLRKEEINPRARAIREGIKEGVMSMVPGLPGIPRQMIREGHRGYEAVKNQFSATYNTQKVTKQQQQANQQAQQAYQSAGLNNASNANYQAQRNVLSSNLNIAKAAANTLNKLASQNTKMQQNQNLFNSGVKQRSWFDKINPKTLGNEQYAVDTIAAAQDQEKEWHTSLANDMNNIAKPTAKKTGNTFNAITNQDIHQVVSTGDGDALKQKLMLNGIEEAKATQIVEAIKQDTELAELRKTLAPFDGRIFRDDAQNINPKNASPEQKTYAFSQTPELNKIKKGSVVADTNGNTFTIKAVDKKGNTITLEGANGTVQNVSLDTFKQTYKDADDIQQTLKTTMGEAQAVLDMANQQKAEIQQKIDTAKAQGNPSLDPAKVKPGSFMVKLTKGRVDTLRTVEVKTDPNTGKVSYVVDLIDASNGKGTTRLTFSYDFLKNRATTLEDIQPSYIANSFNVDSIKNTTKANAATQGTKYYNAQVKYANTQARIMKEQAHYAALGKYNRFMRILQGKAGQVVAEMRNKVLNSMNSASFSLSSNEFANALKEILLAPNDGIAALMGWNNLTGLETSLTKLENLSAKNSQVFFNNLQKVTEEASKLIQETIDNSLNSASSDAEKRLVVNQGLAVAQIITDIATIQTSMFIKGVEKSGNLDNDAAVNSILGLRHISELSLGLKNTYADILGKDRQKMSDTIFGQFSDMFIGNSDMAITDPLAVDYLIKLAKNALKSDGFLGIILNSISEANNADYASQMDKLNAEMHNALSKQHKAFKILKEYSDLLNSGADQSTLDNFWKQETCSL